jgi:hypothetical protein
MHRFVLEIWISYSFKYCLRVVDAEASNPYPVRPTALTITQHASDWCISIYFSVVPPIMNVNYINPFGQVSDLTLELD